MNVEVLDKDGNVLEYNDEVLYWTYDDNGHMDWIPAKIMEIRYVQGRQTTLKVLLDKQYQGRYNVYGHTALISNFKRLRKV